MKESRTKMICSLLLLMTSVIWGLAFVAQSVGTEFVGPWTYVFSRYAISTAVLLPVSFFVDRRNAAKHVEAAPRRIYLAGGACCGLFLGTASIAQQAGIQFTTAGKAGFITALYVIFVPVISIFLGKWPEKKLWLCVALGLAGLYLISVREGFSVGAGDLLMVLCALLFSGQILCISHFTQYADNLVKLANCQFFFCTLFNLIGMLLFEEVHPEAILSAWPSIVYAGLFSGAVGYTLQMAAQKHTDPTVASLIMSLESVFAALFGWIILKEGLSARELTGCLLVFSAVILSEIPVTSARQETQQSEK